MIELKLPLTASKRAGQGIPEPWRNRLICWLIVILLIPAEAMCSENDIDGTTKRYGSRESYPFIFDVHRTLKKSLDPPAKSFGTWTERWAKVKKTA
jgi:hypothetical protein